MKNDTVTYVSRQLNLSVRLVWFEVVKRFCTMLANVPAQVSNCSPCCSITFPLNLCLAG